MWESFYRSGRAAGRNPLQTKTVFGNMLIIQVFDFDQVVAGLKPELL